MDTTRLEDLFSKYYNKTATAEERARLMRLINESSTEELSRLISQFGENLTSIDPVIIPAKAEEILQGILQSPATAVESISPSGTMRRWRYAAAAIVLLVAGGYIMFFANRDKPKGAFTAQAVIRDIKPGQNAAVLTLADGTTINLDSAANGRTMQQGKTIVVNRDNQLLYKQNGRENKEAYNTLSTNRGQTYVTVLADGSTVWLNSVSSIKFPVAFVGKERRVEITGEAYFEVAKNANLPFIIHVKSASGEDGGDIEVLGTHFNINAYGDEEIIRTTLLEGAVKVTKGSSSGLLKPGQQAQVFGALSTSKNRDISIQTVNTEEVIAWKEGWFHFESVDLRSILRQFARWYDVEVIYESPVKNRKYFGIVKRSNSLLNVLDMLKDNNIDFRIEGKKLIVK